MKKKEKLSEKKMKNLKVNHETSKTKIGIFNIFFSF